MENWRWAGTPFYLRSGKRLPKRATEVGIVFREPPYELFGGGRPSRARPNVLRLRIQPDEGISLSFESKTPGQAMRIEEVRMDFFYATSFGEEPPEAYERLMLDAIVGDSTLFARRDEVELSWGIVDSHRGRPGRRSPGTRRRPTRRAAGGRRRRTRLIQADGRKWFRSNHGGDPRRDHPSRREGAPRTRRGSG